MRTAVRARRVSRDDVSGCRLAPLATIPVLGLSTALAAVLVVLSWRAGLSAGELALLAQAHHLSWGYAERPPLLPALVRLLDELGGGSTVVVRLPAAMLSAAGVLVTALTARELGGGRRAQLRACAVYAGAACILSVGYVLSAAPVSAFIWMVCAWLLARWARTGDARLAGWLAVATAVGVQTDYLIVLLWSITLVALLTVGPRELATAPRLWAGLGVALLTAVPELVWQAQHGWPSSIVQLVLNQRLFGPIPGFLPLLPLAAGLVAGAVFAGYGAARLLVGIQLDRYAFLGWTAIGLAAALLLLGVRPALLAGVFPALWAAAAVELDRPASPRTWRLLASWPVLALSALLGLPGAPGLPGWAGWPSGQTNLISWLTRADSFTTGRGARTELVPRLGPRHSADAWTRFAEAVAATYRTLPDKSLTVIITRSGWAAAALDRFGHDLGLPAVYSARGDYGFFDEPPLDTQRVLYVGDPSAIQPFFDQLRPLGTVPEVARRSSAFPTGTPLWLVEGPHEPWSRLWPQLRTAERSSG